MRNCPAILAAALALALAMAAPAARAAIKDVQITGQTAGSTPFISLLTLVMDDPGELVSYTFTIQPKPGSSTRAISARYSSEYLQQRGFLTADSKQITAPVFGLYANFQNTVQVVFRFVDGRSQEESLSIQTSAFHSPVYKRGLVLLPRTPGSPLSYDFILLKNATTDSPTILDTDGEIRWVGFSAAASFASILYKNSVYIGFGTAILRMEFDGAVTSLNDFAVAGVTDYHHNLDFGRDGILAGVNTSADIEAVILEIDTNGHVLHTWNLADIISNAMVAGGDDPALFVNRAGDWFHNNAAAYRASDNTLIVSSREDFVIALDYDTGAIRWILGATDKNWHQFASLRKYALDLGPNTHSPIGQHAVSLDRDRLLLFDDGFQSLNQTPTGRSRPYSAPRMYKIDTAAHTATEVWTYPNGKSIYSPVCSSVYSDGPHSFLVDYATGGPYLFTELLGVDRAGNKAFDYRYTAVDTCSVGWNAVPIHLEDMNFDSY